MRVFKNKVVRRILSLVLLICLVIVLDLLMEYLLSKVTYANWFNASVREIEASGEDADLVFIGASRTHRTFVPQVFREKLNLTWVLNAGSSGQPVRATYYELKDLIERLHPHHVILGVTWDEMRGGTSLQGRLIVYDRLSLKNRLLMIAGGFDPDEWPYLCASYRFKDNFNLETIRKNITEKTQLAQLNYKDPEDGPKKHDYGYDYRYASIQTGNMPIKHTSGGFSTEKVKERNYNFLSACVDLCKKNNIEVTLASGLTSVMRMYAVDNYQGAVDFYTEFARERGISYYNLNYLKDRETILPDEMMHDLNHVNDDGAFLVSGIFAEILDKAGRGEDVSSYFYANMEEFKKDVHRIVAVGAQVTEDTEDADIYHVSAENLQDEDVEVVYRALIRKPGQENFEVIQDWTPQSQMDLHIEEGTGSTLRIEAGSKDGTYGFAYQEYTLRAGMSEGEKPEDEES